MASHYNKIILLGNMTRDPQLSYLPNETPVCEIGLAVNRKWRGQDGQMKGSVCFIDCRAYGKKGETINQYMRKGKPIMIEGHLDLDQWEAQDGTKRSKHRVTIEKFAFMSQGTSSSHQAETPEPKKQQAPPMGDQQPPPGHDEVPGENIPF